MVRMDLITRQQAGEVLADRRRLLPLAVAASGYAFAGVTVPLLLLFSGGWWLPKTVDAGTRLSAGPAVAVDVLLVSVFGLQHSGMARPAVKAFFARYVADSLERTLYVVTASLAVWLLCLAWQPVPKLLWSPGGVLARALDVGFWVGLALVYAATMLLGHTHLLGLRQAYRCYVTRTPEANSDGLRVHGPYRLVRHPLMTGLLLVFWCTSTLTVGHLLWATGLTSYIMLGTLLEERDLLRRFGGAYGAYAARVPAFFPSLSAMVAALRGDRRSTGTGSQGGGRMDVPAHTDTAP